MDEQSPAPNNVIDGDNEQLVLTMPVLERRCRVGWRRCSGEIGSDLDPRSGSHHCIRMRSSCEVNNR